MVIHRWNVTYRVPEGVPFTHADRHRLDELLRSGIRETLARSVECSIDASDLSVWRIRSLAIELNHEPGHPYGAGEQKTWAARLAGSILDEMKDPDSSRVLRFPTRADYLAHFLIDLVRGRAWDRWYFEDFDSLRPLSTSRAICEALLREEGDVAATLLAVMAANGLHDVLDVLTATDAERLFNAWPYGSAPSAGVQSFWVERLLDAWSQTPCRISGDNPFRDGLCWLVIAASRYPGCEVEREPVKAASSLLQIRSLFLSLPSLWHRGRLIQLISQGQLHQAAQFAFSPSLPSPHAAIAAMAALMEGDLDWGLNAISILTGDQAAGFRDGANGPSRGGESYLSHFAGVFRLGPSFLATSVTKILAAAGQPALLPLLMHLVAAKCLGAVRAQVSLHDIALSLFSGLGPNSFAVLFDELLSDGTFAALDHQAMQNALRHELLTAGRTSPSHWIIVPCRSANLLIDSESLAWLDITSPSGPRFPSLRLYPDTQFATVDEASLTGRSPSIDLDHFSLAGVLPALPSQLDLTLTLIAHCVLTHFARRLLGFRLSSPQHLCENFLAGSGTLRDTGAGLEVALAPPPLAIVLRLAGIDRENCTVTWLPSFPEGRELCILPEQI